MADKKQDRKWLPTPGEMIDRLSILSLKFVNNPDKQSEYGKEIDNILHDLQKSVGGANFPPKQLTAGFIWDIIVLAQYNQMIWNQEDNARKGKKDGNKLFLTHSLNGIRCQAKDKINQSMGERVDPKVNSVASDYKGQYTPHGY